MVRIVMMLMVLAGFALSSGGCTNTVRGLAEDVNSDTMREYNARDGVYYESRTATEID
jgi:predicted small secreted protein